TLFEGLVGIGKAFVSGFTEIHGALVKGLSGFLNEFAFGSAVFSEGTKVGWVLSNAVGAAMASGIGFGLGKGLEAMGAPAVLTNIVTAFASAFTMGALNPVGTLSALKTASLFALGSAGLTGLSEIALNIGIPPPLVSGFNAIGNLALTAGIEAFGSPDLTFSSLIKDKIPTITGVLGGTGLETLGYELGWDGRITALIGVPVRAALGVGVDSLLHADSVNFTSLSAAIKNGLAAGASSIGLSTGGIGSILRSITSTSLLSSIGSSIASSDIFGQFFGLAKDIVLSPFKVLGGLGSTLQSFWSVIQEKGLGGALESFATSIFSRQTVETIFNAGGIGGFLDDIQLDTLLPTGTQAKELKIGGVASLFFDLTGKLIGVLENGVYRIGEFVVDALGQVKLLSGKLIAAILGNDIEADVLNGNIQNFRATIDGVDIEGESDGGIFIPGPAPESGSGNIFGNLFSGLIKIAGGALAFAVDSGLLTEIFTIPDAEASMILPPIGLPGPPINLGNILLESLLKNKTLTSTETQQIKDNFSWLVHYTDTNGFTQITDSNFIRKGEEGAFMSKEIPTLTNGDSLDPLGGPRREIAMNLQLHYDTSDHINPEKAMYFFVVDSSEFTDPLIRPVARTELKDPDGNDQPATPITGATEYVFDHPLDIAGKIIYSGFNSVAGWGAALLKMLQYFIEKMKS
ncbi:MAG: hypothetical protein JW902_04640, partial [Syntrophaceae bacterium]|nr:hypothetical protein [Syntrophaceae bacterium]